MVFFAQCLSINSFSVMLEIVVGHPSDLKVDFRLRGNDALKMQPIIRLFIFILCHAPIQSGHPFFSSSLDCPIKSGNDK